ncbi:MULTISPECIES: uroporphyrinogen-III synthase [Psychrobacter]|uniref:uroporphyrinogen-III synthase n=1 Tax=Psychrobacter TaxID=497 RepID=UPI000ED8632B|nr:MULTISPECIES: uroporphyrinogen-III synthase [Psychrobacter]HCH26640.1 uroporphyrinogen-III synthase [Psychrobacter sp.]
MSSTSSHPTPTARHKSAAPSAPTRVVINTRPVERAAPLTQHLQAAGLSVVEIPMLTLQPRPTTDADMALMRQWFAGDYQALVIVSPTAAAAGLAVWQALARERHAQHSETNGDNQNDESQKTTERQNLSAPSHLIAVGEATAAVLNEAKIKAASYHVLQPRVANNEGMLAMPEIDSLQAGDKLLVWRGLGGRRLLVNTLQARGVHIDSIAWYERIMPHEAYRQYNQWLQQFSTAASVPSPLSSEAVPAAPSTAQHPKPIPKQSKPVVIISSATAFEHWRQVISQGKRQATDETSAEDTVKQPLADSTGADGLPKLKLSDFAYVVLGERLANMVADEQLSYWRVEDLAPATILAAISA